MRLTVGSSPHVRHDDNITIMMGDMIIAIIPIICASVYFYGVRVLTLAIISVLSCISFEYLYRRILRKPRSLGDLSAVVTGVIIACCLPVSAPWWFPVAGAFFAIIIVKQLFGGLGRNLFNPALAAVIFLTITWPGTMSVFTKPFASLPLISTPHDFDTAVTSLSILKEGLLPDISLAEMFFGEKAGYIGTGAVLVMLVAGLYLLYRRIINWQIPFAFLGTVAIVAALFPRSPSGSLSSVLYELMSGSVIFVAIFMACEPVTSPVSKTGRLIYGMLCGAITMFLRYYGSYQEGAFFALLFMNPFAMSIDLLVWKQKVWFMRKGMVPFEKN